MLLRTITKFCLFVIFAAAALSCAHFAADGREKPQFDRGASAYNDPVIAGRIESPDISESSGLAYSKCSPEVLWTHNDAGDDAFIFAMSTNGKHLGTWKVMGATNADWEDMATIRNENGACYLYIGDIGDNGKKRGKGTIYRVKEPALGPDAAGSSSKAPLSTEPAEVLEFTYDTKHDAETLLVHPRTEDIYILTKRKDGPSTIFKLSRPKFGGGGSNAQKLGEIALPAIANGLITGGDISSDGNRVALCDYVAGYELVLPADTGNFDDIWRQQPTKFDIGDRDVGETIAYSGDGQILYSTSEGKSQPIFKMSRK